MSSIAIYTFRQEDAPMPAQPYNAAAWKAKGFDFICFVTRKADLPDFEGAWYIDELPISWKDARLNAVLPKLNPQSVLEGYEYSVWVDPDIIISDDSFYERCKELQRQGVLYAHHPKAALSSPYSYIWKLYREKKEPFKVAFKAACFLLGKGIGPFSGLHDTSVLFRRHEAPEVLEFDRWWWECLLTHAGGHYDNTVHLFALRDTPSLKAVEF